MGAHRVNWHLKRTIRKRKFLPLASNCSLCVREDGGNGVALRALHVHEVGVGRLNKSLQFVLTFLGDGIYVQDVDVHCILSYKVLNIY